MELIIGSNRMQQVEGVTAEYPYVLNRADSSQLRVPWHWHEEVEFSLVRQGRLLVTISGQQHTFAAGEGFFLNANAMHTMEPADSAVPVLWDSHMLHPMLLGGATKSVFDSKYMAPVLRNRRFDLVVFRGETSRQQEILSLLDQAAAAQSQPFAEFRTRNLFSEIWLFLMQELKELDDHTGTHRQVDQERLRPMLEYIHRHHGEKLTLEQIAAEAAVSKRECLRCFRSCIGKSPIGYLLDYRIQMAERLLCTTALPVTEIALRTGFSNSAYFAKVFRELRDCAPSQYRNRELLKRKREIP